MNSISSSVPFTSVVINFSNGFVRERNIIVFKTLKRRCASAVCTPGSEEKYSMLQEKGLRKIIKRRVPIAAKRKSASPTLFAYILSFKEIKKAVTLVPKLAPRIIGIETSMGISPPWARITIIPVVTELECIRAVNIALTRNATTGFERLEKKSITSGFSFRGDSVEESREREKSKKPRKKSGLLINFVFLPKIFNINPVIISSGARTVESSNTNCAVIVVPILAPKIIPKLLLNEITPVLTSDTVITFTAVLDWIIAVRIEPKRVPMYLFLDTLPRNSLNLLVARSCISLLRLSIAYKKSIIAEIKAKAICKYSESKIFISKIYHNRYINTA